MPSFVMARTSKWSSWWFPRVLVSRRLSLALIQSLFLETLMSRWPVFVDHENTFLSIALNNHIAQTHPKLWNMVLRIEILLLIPPLPKQPCRHGVNPSLLMSYTKHCNVRTCLTTKLHIYHLDEGVSKPSLQCDELHFSGFWVKDSRN